MLVLYTVKLGHELKDYQFVLFVYVAIVVLQPSSYGHSFAYSILHGCPLVPYRMRI
jgi:hypothetical protein